MQRIIEKNAGTGVLGRVYVISNPVEQPPASLSDDCASALRDVRFGENLIARKAYPDALMLPLVATKAAIEAALVACKAQSPVPELRRKERIIDERIKQVEDQLLPSLPKLPSDVKIGRRAANIG